MLDFKDGEWDVLSFTKKDLKSNNYYMCRCSCGIIKERRLNTSKKCKICSTKILNSVDELVGKMFGFWTVKSKQKNESRNEWFYECHCKCGTIRSMAAHHLKSRQSTKCHKCRVKTHGMSYTDTFKIWTGILRRCNNPNFKHYKYYGGRGIKICDRWLVFENFFEDMGHRPAGLSIDRINNDGNYEPGNCRWVTTAENNSNRKVSKKKEN